MKNQILHNPYCSKSRATLDLLTERKLDVAVTDYQKTPLDKDELRKICGLLGKQPLDIMRVNDVLFSDLGLSKDNGYSDEQWLDVLVAHPKLLERPIVIYNGKAAIGRPIENVMAIL
jgi:arsenate reductase